MTAQELATKCNVKLWKVYYIAEKLGRLPSVDEIINWKQKKRGRHPTRWQQNKEKEN